MSAEEKKGDEKDGQINLKVKDPNGSSVFFKVKRTTKLGKLMDAYCKRVGKEKRRDAGPGT